MTQGVYPRFVKTCAVDGCERMHLAAGLCNMHYLRKRQYGRLTLVRREKGSGGYDSKGYKLITVDGVQKREHVAIAERILGRRLRDGECVHHVNGDPADNRNENLVICPSNAYHKLLHKRQAFFERKK